MSIKVEKGYFNGLEGALNDIKSQALWPTTYATDHATAAQLHWHSEDVHGYVVEGEIYITDNDGHRHDLQAGDKITIPARTLHAEGEIDAPVALVVGLPVAVPLDQFLFARNPNDL
jgi:mannose-6-phosphate isomerase-like protein (cupin superfamily)